MIPPPLELGTDATVEVLPRLGMTGGPVALVIIKLAFQVTAKQEVERLPGAEVRFSDVPWDEKKPETSSVKFPSDICLRKPGTDVIVVGNAMAPRKAKVKALDVLVRVGALERRLRVCGLRVWSQGLVGLSLTEPLPFEELPLKWENAWGGFDGTIPGKPLEEPRNPVGRGVAHDPKALVHQPAPQIEDPAAPIKSERGKPIPAGVGAIGPHWDPRRRYAGTHDEKWKKERMPLLPLDFDERHNQVAAPGLIATPYLRGGEQVELVNLCEDGPLRFALPSVFFFVGPVIDGAAVEQRPVLDTVLLQPNDRRFELTWRVAVPWPSPAHRLEAIRVYEKEALA